MNRFLTAIQHAQAHNATAAERNKAVYHRRRAAGQCVRCGRPTSKSVCEDCAVIQKCYALGVKPEKNGGPE